MDYEQPYGESVPEENPQDDEQGHAAEESGKPKKTSRRQRKAAAEMTADTTETEASEGFDLSPLYEHMPPAFTTALTSALRARGLVEAADYFKPNAAELYRSAMLSVIKSDFLNAQAKAKSELGPAANRMRGRRS